MNVAVVEKIFLLLETLAQAEKPLPLKRLTELTELPKPTVYRLLKTLQELGYVVRHGATNDYLMGHRIAELACGLQHRRLKEAAHPLMKRLYKAANETVNLGVREGLCVRYVEYLETSCPLRLIVRPGQSDNLFSSALGRAILSTHSQEEVVRLVGLSRSTFPGEKTHPRPLALKSLLAAIRKRGWSQENEETTEGVCCVAISLKSLGFPEAAVSVSIPKVRFTPTCRRQIENIFQKFLRSPRPPSAWRR
jgi:DNA-binding IclR family transcriptional regulator